MVLSPVVCFSTPRLYDYVTIKLREFYGVSEENYPLSGR